MDTKVLLNKVLRYLEVNDTGKLHAFKSKPDHLTAKMETTKPIILFSYWII